MNEKYYVIASEMVDQCMERWGTKCKKISSVIGNKLKEIELLHPFINRKSVLLHGDHVTTETGTGCVHTAPAHGGPTRPVLPLAKHQHNLVLFQYDGTVPL